MIQATPSALDHVLILAPYRQDAGYLAQLLKDHDIGSQVGARDEGLSDQLVSAPAVILATHEALTPGAINLVAEHVNTQPDWSEIPIIVLLDRASSDEQVKSQLGRAWPRARLLFYRRPVATVELLSGVQSALLARHRQRDVRDHIEREVELRRELNHRVKNILASVASIFEMTRRNTDSVQALSEDFRGRLNALDKVHSAVFRAEADVISLKDVAAITLEPYRASEDHRIEFDGPSITVLAETGTTLALCLHELATNAIKYGALSVPAGKVALCWDIETGEEPSLTLTWSERDGPSVIEPSRVGYGTRYVRAALGSLFGAQPTFQFNRDGLRMHVQGPLSRLAAAT